MFKGIKDKLKYKSGVKYLKEEIKKPFEPIKRTAGITSVACLVNLDAFENANLFYEFVDDFGLRPNAIKIIGYKSEYDKNSPYSTPVFSDKDLGWKGEIENSYVLEFLGREYDMLINYFTDDNLMLQIMSVKTKARVRVGFKEIDPKFNDLILDAPIQDFKIFKRELKKYLRVLNEIK